MKDLIKKILSEENDWDWMVDVSPEKDMNNYLHKDIRATMTLELWLRSNLGYVGSLIVELEDGYIVATKDEDGYDIEMSYLTTEEITDFLGYDYVEENEHRDCDGEELDVVNQLFPNIVGCKII
jgi:hypothetical protein